MKSTRMRGHEAQSKRERLKRVLEKQPDLDTEILCLRFACGSTFVNTVRREVKDGR